MKEVRYSCDLCSKDLGSSFSDAKSDMGAVELSLKGTIRKGDSWAKQTDKQFCSVPCLADYMSTLAKEFITQDIVDQ